MTLQSFFRQYWKSILISLSIVYLSLAPPSEFKNVPEVIAFVGSDKIVHFLMYFALTIVAVYDFKKSRNVLNIFVQCAIFPFLLGGTMEVLQHFFTVHRSGDWLDLLANTVGIATAYLLMKFIKRKK